MTRDKLIDLYGRRFTSFGKITGLIAILLFGILAVFSQPEIFEGEEVTTPVEELHLDPQDDQESSET